MFHMLSVKHGGGGMMVWVNQCEAQRQNAQQLPLGNAVKPQQNLTVCASFPTPKILSYVLKIRHFIY